MGTGEVFGLLGPNGAGKTTTVGVAIIAFSVIFLALGLKNFRRKVLA